MIDIRFCNKCLFPETKPDLYFNEDGICSACIGAERKDNSIDWKQREKDFNKIIDKFRLKNDQIGYDCLIPVSGGKDSTYQAYFMKEVCKMNPLCVCFETTMSTELGKRNLDNLSKMGMDVIHFKKNSNVYKSMVIEGFKRLGDEMWPNHVGIFTIPIMIAVKFKIPLIVWGENSQNEYGGPLEKSNNKFLDRSWLEEFGGLLGLRVSDLVGVEGIKKKIFSIILIQTSKKYKKLIFKVFFWDIFLNGMD